MSGAHGCSKRPGVALIGAQSFHERHSWALRTVHEWHSRVLNASMSGTRGRSELPCVGRSEASMSGTHGCSMRPWVALKVRMSGTHGRSKRPCVALMGAQSVHGWTSWALKASMLGTHGRTRAIPCRPGCSSWVRHPPGLRTRGMGPRAHGKNIADLAAALGPFTFPMRARCWGKSWPPWKAHEEVETWLMQAGRSEDVARKFSQHPEGRHAAKCGKAFFLAAIADLQSLSKALHDLELFAGTDIFSPRPPALLRVVSSADIVKTCRAVEGLAGYVKVPHGTTTMQCWP